MSDREQILEQRRKDQVEAIKRELMKDQNRRVREALEFWANNTEERAA